MSESNRIIFSVKALIFYHDKFLLLHKNSNYRMPKFLWDLPGGTLEFGESPQETIRREITEETGLNIQNLKLYDTWMYRKDESTQLTGVIYLGQTEDNQVVLSKEHDKYLWVSLNDSEIDSIHPAFRPAIMKMKDESTNIK